MIFFRSVSPSCYSHYSSSLRLLRSSIKKGGKQKYSLLFIMPAAATSSVIHRSLDADFPQIVGSEGNYVVLEDGRRIFDASGGAAVACIGHGNTRVHDAIVAQLKQISYCSTTFYTTDVCERLCRELVDSTHGIMKRAYIVNSGTHTNLSRQSCCN